MVKVDLRWSGKTILHFALLSATLIAAGATAAFAETCNNYDINNRTIAAGAYHSVAIRNDGTVIATGRNLGDSQNVASWTDIKSVAAGSEHTVGLKEDGTVVTTLPASGYWNSVYEELISWTNIKAIAAGPYHTVALKEDGTVVAAGKYNDRGQLDTSSWTNIKAITAGWTYTAGLTEDGKVVIAGALGGTETWHDIKDISSGGYHLAGLVGESTSGKKASGLVTAGTGKRDPRAATRNVPILKGVATGTYITLGLKTDGTVIALGDAARNPYGVEYNYGQFSVDDWTNISQLEAGHYHSVGLKEDGTMVAVGDNTYGQMEVSYWSDIRQPACLDPATPDSL